MNLDDLTASVIPTLEGFSADEVRKLLEEAALVFGRSHRRAQLTLKQLRFRGEKNGRFTFHPGVNVLRAGNNKGKSSILKLIKFCLTGKNELKPDVSAWISSIDLAFAIDDKLFAIHVDNATRPAGRLIQGTMDDLEAADDTVASVVSFNSAVAMKQGLEEFFSERFGLRTLVGTQKDSRKDSVELLDNKTGYMSYFQGLYVSQDSGYSDLVTEGHHFGNLYMKVVGMLLGYAGLDGVFALESKIAHVDNSLARQEVYKQQADAAKKTRTLKQVEAELKESEDTFAKLKLERAGLLEQAASTELDRELNDLTTGILSADAELAAIATSLHTAEKDLEETERGILLLTEALASKQYLSPIRPQHCPVCEGAIRKPEPQAHAPGTCLLCHNDVLPGADQKVLADIQARLSEVRQSKTQENKTVGDLRLELQSRRDSLSGLLGRKAQTQHRLRAARRGTEEVDRSLELAVRRLGRLEAERDTIARLLPDGGGVEVAALLRSKSVYTAALRHLRTAEASINEKMKGAFARRIREYCTIIGFPGLEDVTLDARLWPEIRQNGHACKFSDLAPGEKVRFVLAFYFALAIATAENAEFGAHPGLLLIDSPGKEEMVKKDFSEVVGLLKVIEKKHSASIQAIVATTLPAIRNATDRTKQVYKRSGDEPLFT